jgi:hypothetical protein
VVEVIRVANEVNVHISWCSDGLPALSAPDNFLEFRPCRLDLATRVLYLLNFLIWICLNKVVITGENRAALIREVLPLELLTLFNALAELFLFLF